jgi:hypothetical protein
MILIIMIIVIIIVDNTKYYCYCCTGCRVLLLHWMVDGGVCVCMCGVCTYVPAGCPISGCFGIASPCGCGRGMGRGRGGGRTEYSGGGL